LIAGAPYNAATFAIAAPSQAKNESIRYAILRCNSESRAAAGNIQHLALTQKIVSCVRDRCAKKDAPARRFALFRPVRVSTYGGHRRDLEKTDGKVDR
jgi:hypothetical protein